MSTNKIIIIIVILINLIRYNEAIKGVVNNGIGISIDDTVLCPEQPLCPCVCSECGPVNIKSTSKKHIYAYITSGLQGNYSYFSNDSTFKWDSVDTIALYSSGFDKKISCLAHRNQVKIEFVVEEGDIFTNFTNLKPTAYWDAYINITNLVGILQDNNVDGYNLDFEYGNRYGTGNQFANSLQVINNGLKQVNSNYSLSVALTARYGSNLSNQFLLVTQNVDLLIVMAYDCSSWPIGSNFTAHANSPDSVRQSIKSNYIDPLGGVYSKLLSKVILALPFYGYITQCSSPNNTYFTSNPGAAIFTNTCIVESNPFEVAFFDLYNSLFNSPDEGSDDGNQGGKRIKITIDSRFNKTLYLSTIPSLTSGIEWDSGTDTVFSSFIDSSTGDIWQIVFDSPYSIYQKVNQIGIGGVGVWTLEKIKDLPQPLVDSFYYSISRDIIGDIYIDTQ